MLVRVEQGDCREVIPKLGVMVDAVVTDPPYEIGFMGREWDKRGVAFDPKTWRAVHSALRPGGFLVAFGGTRTYHRLVSAIEDAGFVIQDQIAWLFGSGFPKRRDMLKPAFEPICLAYKPGGKRTLQVDECRIDTGEKLSRYEPNGRINSLPGDTRVGAALGMFQPGSRRNEHAQPSGRWPANVCHSGEDEVIEAFAAFGERTGGKLLPTHNAKPSANGSMSGGNYAGRVHSEFGGDSGSAARFFYAAKADKTDRWGSRHPTVKPVELMKWLVPLVTPAGGLVLDPFAGSGTTGVAALATGRDCILIEREEQYLNDIRQRLAFYEGGGAHSVQAKNRSRKTEAGPLFAANPLGRP